MDGIQITTGTADDIPRLEPLWVSVHHQHVASMPELAPYVSDEVTWRERRALYVELFRKPDTLLLLASEAERLVGYALVHTMPAEETWVGDTWVTGPVIAELESIAVLPDRRGAGIGSPCSTRSTASWRNAGSMTSCWARCPGNADAIRLTSGAGSGPPGSTSADSATPERTDGRHGGRTLPYGNPYGMVHDMARKQVLVQLDDLQVTALDGLASAADDSRSELIPPGDRPLRRSHRRSGGRRPLRPGI